MYTLKCKKCSSVKKTNYQQFKKKEKAGTLKKHVCQVCQRASKKKVVKEKVTKKTAKKNERSRK